MTYPKHWNVMWGKRQGIWGKCAFCSEKVKNAGEKHIPAVDSTGQTLGARFRVGQAWCGCNGQVTGAVSDKFTLARCPDLVLLRLLGCPGQSRPLSDPAKIAAARTLLAVTVRPVCSFRRPVGWSVSSQLGSRPPAERHHVPVHCDRRRPRAAIGLRTATVPTDHPLTLHYRPTIDSSVQRVFGIKSRPSALCTRAQGSYGQPHKCMVTEAGSRLPVVAQGSLLMGTLFKRQNCSGASTMVESQICKYPQLFGRQSFSGASTMVESLICRPHICS